MHVCMCVCVCMYVCMYVCIHIYVYTYIHMFIYLYIYIYTHNSKAHGSFTCRMHYLWVGTIPCLYMGSTAPAPKGTELGVLLGFVIAPGLVKDRFSQLPYFGYAVCDFGV